MIMRAIHRKDGEGVTSWVRLFSIVAVIALVFSMISMTPTRAWADEVDDAVSADVNDAGDATPEAPAAPAVGDQQVVVDPPPSAEATTAPATPPAPTTTLVPPVQQVPEYNADISVTVRDILVEGKNAQDSAVKGDDLVVSGSWSVGSADVENGGTKFYVTFPTDILGGLKVTRPSDGITLLRDDSGEVIGIEGDVSNAGSSGTWRVTATALEATDATRLPFRTSHATVDVQVGLPGTEGILAEAAPTSEARAAASDDGITVTIDKIENASGAGVDKKLEPGDNAKISGTWTAPPGVKSGDSFKITLPEVFTFPEADTFDLVGDGKIWGECTISGRILECVLSETVDGLDDVHGTWYVYARATEKTASETVTFEVEGGAPIVVELPGENGGIGTIKPLPTDISKRGSKAGDQRTVTWTVDLPGSVLQGQSVPLTFVDTPSGSQQIVPDSGKIRYYTDPENVNGSMRDVAGGSVVLGAQDAETNAFDITINPNEAWDPLKVYRVTYQTRTAGLEDPGTPFTNSFGAAGEEGVGSNAGTVTWKTGKAKNNTYQAFDWQILVSGKSRSATGTIVVTDELIDGPHEVTAETGTSLNVLKNGAALSGDVISFTRESDKKLSIVITDPEAKDTDVYTVTYTTFYAGTETHPKGGLPDGGTIFKNKARVGNLEMSGSVTVPGYRSTKNGRLNNAPVTIGGVTHPRNSTLTWQLWISGNKLDRLNPITVTDEIGDNHQVCGGTGAPEERLGATLTVIDRITGKVVTDHKVTFSAEISADSKQVAYTLVEGDGEFNRNHQYRIEYTTCTTSGGQDEYGTVYKNKAVGNGVDTSSSVTIQRGAGGTGTGVSQGSFSLEKVASSNSEKFGEDLIFTVKAEEFAPSAFDEAGNLKDGARPAETYNVEVKADGTSVSGLNSRGNGWKIRLSEIGLPQGTGLAWAPGVFRAGNGVELVEDGRVAWVTTNPGNNVSVTLANTASKGSVSIEKKIVGGPEGYDWSDRAFTVTPIINFNGKQTSGATFNLYPGVVHEITGLPIGAVVTFREVQPTNDAEFTWGAPVFSPESVTVGDPAAGLVTLTNTVAETQGTFSLHKIVKGTEQENPNLPENVTVKTTWEGGSKDIILPLDGTVIPFGEFLKTGTQVTLEEILPAGTSNLEWASAGFSGAGVSVVDGKTVITIGTGDAAVTVKNIVVEKGTLQIVKQVAGDAAARVDSDVEFTVKAEWKLPGETAYTFKDLVLKNDGLPVALGESLPVGTEVRFTETGTPDVAGVTWGPVTWNGDAWMTVNGATATGVISDNPAEGRLVTLTNHAENADRPVYIQKDVIGEANDKVGDISYVVKAKINGSDEEHSYTIKRGVKSRIGDFPVGTVIEFTEVQPENTDQVTWETPIFVPGNTITVSADSLETLVQLKNEAKHTFGSFSITKKVIGPEAGNDNVPESFKVRATWTENGEEHSEVLEVPANGSVNFPHQLMNGTQVHLEEIDLHDGNGIAWGIPAFSGDVIVTGGETVVTIGKDIQQVQIKNHADVNDGTLRITKAITGEAAETVPENTEFEVEASWKDGTEYESRTLKVKNGESTELGVDLPIGTEVTFKELDRPEIEGVEWGSISWATNPEGGSWIKNNADGTVTGIVSDDPEQGRLITLSNEALWAYGAISIEKFIDGEEAAKFDLAEDAEFQIKLDKIDLPTGKSIRTGADLAEGDIITLNADNEFYWESDTVLPKGTKVTFSEIDPQALPGVDWALPIYTVVSDAGEAGDRDHAVIVAGEIAEIEIHNRSVPTVEVDIEKIVTGPLGGAISKNENTLFQVTATWTDIDGIDRRCVLDVVPGKPAVPTTDCDATVIDGKVYFPVDTEITFVETGAYTDVKHVKWSDVIWSVKEGSAELTKHGQAGVKAILSGGVDEPITLGLENKTGSGGGGLIIIPIPIPGGGVPGVPGGPTTPNVPGSPSSPTAPVQPGVPGSPDNAKTGVKATTGGSGLANTGANVLWLAGGGLLLLLGGAWLALRGRNKDA